MFSPPSTATCKQSCCFCCFVKTLIHFPLDTHRWDDWVPQDRLRKLNDENKELAANLKKEMEDSLRANTNTKASASATSKRKSKLVDRGLAAAAGANTGDDAHGRQGGGAGGAGGPSRGSKRGRELDMERVSLCLCYVLRVIYIFEG